MKALNIYEGSDGAVTRAYYAALERRGPPGIVAMNLFRAQKCSARAKCYHGGIRGVGSYRSLAYSRKGWALEELCKALTLYGELHIRFGWKKDSKLPDSTPNWVLYVDLPEGQVSFHSLARYAGPDYPAEWDGQRGASEMRILRFCDRAYDSLFEESQSTVQYTLLRCKQ